MLFFIALGGHLILLSVLQYSFEAVPLAGEAISGAMLMGLVNWSGTMFIGAAALAFLVTWTACNECLSRIDCKSSS